MDRDVFEDLNLATMPKPRRGSATQLDGFCRTEERQSRSPSGHFILRGARRARALRQGQRGIPVSPPLVRRNARPAHSSPDVSGRICLSTR